MGRPPSPSAAMLRFGQARLCLPTLEQMAALAVVDTPPEYFERALAEYRARRDADFDDAGETVMLAPAAGFYATPGLGERAVRIAFVLNVGSVRRSMEILAKALAAYPGRLALPA